MALARTELLVAVLGARASIPWALAAGMLLPASLLALATSITLLLAQWLPAWLSAALVGIALALIALTFLRRAPAFRSAQHGVVSYAALTEE